MLNRLQVRLGAWLLPVSSTLRSLKVSYGAADVAVPAGAPLHCLTALQELVLSAHDGGELLFHPSCRPPTQPLTKLDLDFICTENPQPLPSQARHPAKMYSVAVSELWMPSGAYLTWESHLLCVPVHVCVCVLAWCACAFLPLCVGAKCQFALLSFSVACGHPGLGWVG